MLARYLLDVTFKHEKFVGAMSLLLLFKREAPRHWRELKVEGLEVESLGAGGSKIEGRFVVVVGDGELAERLGVGHMSEEEAEDFYQFLTKTLSGAA